MPSTLYFYPNERNPYPPTPANRPTKRHRPRKVKETPSCFLRGLHFLFRCQRPDVTNVSQAHAKYQTLADVFKDKDI